MSQTVDPPRAMSERIQSAWAKLVTHRQGWHPFSIVFPVLTRQARPKLSIGVWLFALALAAVLPVIVFATVAAWGVVTATQHATLSELQHRSDVARNKVSRYLLSVHELAVTLASSNSVVAGNLSDFYVFAKRAIAAGKIGRNVVVVDRDRQQLMNTRVPFGEALPIAGDRLGITETFARELPQASNLFKGSVAARNLFTVWAPVIRDGQVTLAVGVTVEPQDLTAVLQEEPLPGGWIGVVVDRNGIIVARTHEAETFTGRPAPDFVLAAIKTGQRGVFTGTMPEGTSVLAISQQVPIFGWAMVLGVPKQQYDAPAFRSLKILLAMGIVALSLAGMFAFLVGREMRREIASIGRSAMAVGEGREMEVEPLMVRELNGVSSALMLARRLIVEREAAQIESEARLHSILEATNVMAWEADLSTDCVRTVGPAARLFDQPDGFRMETREAFLRCIGAEDRNRVRAEFAAAALAKQPFHSEFRVPLSAGGIRWISSAGVVEDDDSGQPARMRGISFDITSRKRADLALADAVRITAVACEAGHMGTWHRDVATNRLTYSDELLSLIGIERHQWGGTPEALEPFMHPDDIEHRRRMRAMAEAGGDRIDIDFRICRPNGEVRWVQSRGRMRRHANGTPIESFGVMMDVTDRKLAEEHLRMLVAELDHRVKNVISRVSVVAQRTREGSSSLDDFSAKFEGRIEAMLHAHSLLSSSRWSGANLMTIVREELAPYATPSNTKISGADIVLKPAAAEAVVMVIHELVTNAMKYGAISTATGQVSVSWETVKSEGSMPALVITWKETGGPEVVAPAETGFGTSVIQKLIPYEFGGKVDLTFAPPGVRCRIEIPRSHVV